MSTKTVNPTLNSLTGLRFVAMIPVFAVHGALLGVFDDAELSWAYLNALGTMGQTAVCFFFILSGFVITWAYRPDDTARTFWRRRFFRVYPNHVVVYATTLALMVWLGETIRLPSVLAQLTLVQVWIPDPAFYDTGNTVTWSLSVDVAFYALFPALLVLVNRIRPGRLWYWAGACVLVIALLPAVATTLLPDEPPLPLPEWRASESQYWFVYLFPLSRLLECVLGMILARIVLTGRWIRLRPAVGALLVVAGYVVAQQLPFLYRMSAVIVVPLALFTAAVAEADLHGSGTPLGSRVMVWLGNLSFAFYLVHNIVLKYGHFAFGRTEIDGELEAPTRKAMPPGTGQVGAFVVSLLLSWALYTGVEEPIRRWSRRLDRARRAARSEQQKISPGR
jgi:peptidoglycan/LPS O-acetylase OafA/YrhL